jgi:hypothetical protein
MIATGTIWKGLTKSAWEDLVEATIPMSIENLKAVIVGESVSGIICALSNVAMAAWISSMASKFIWAANTILEQKSLITSYTSLPSQSPFETNNTWRS